MARSKKKESALTPEEKLAQALVPDWEQPYMVPKNWRWVYLFKGAAECMDSFRKPVNATERADREGEIPYYGATGQVGWIDDYLTDEELVLLGEDGAPFLDPLKDKAYLITGKAWVNNHAHILRSYYGSAGNQYLVNYLNTFNYKGYVNGTTRLKLTQASMDIMPVPIPPLAEQQRIVDRIEYLFAKLDEAKEKALSVLDSFETRKAAILHKAFTGELTAKWRLEHGISDNSWSTVDITRIAKTGKDALKAGPFGSALKKSMYVPEGYKIYGQEQVIAGDETIGDYYIDENKYQELISCKIAPHDILISLVGTVGKVLVLSDTCKPGIINPRLIKVSLNERIMIPYFFKYYFESDSLKEKYKGESHGITMDVLNMRILKMLPFPLCTLDEQTEIVRILDSLIDKEQKAKEAAEAMLEKIDLLKKSILARAFRGELGTNDPTEESALELLKKILDIPTEPKAPVKRAFIPKDLENQIKTELERKIIKLYIQGDTDIIPISQMMSVSSKKFELMDTLRSLQQRGILAKEDDTYKLLR